MSWSKLKQILEYLGQVALVVSAVVFVYEARTARKTFDHSALAFQEAVRVSKIEFGDTWVRQLIEPDFFDQFVEVNKFFSRGDLTSPQKIAQIESDETLQREVYRVLGAWEELAILYNMDALDRERILRGCSAGGIALFNNGWFWIEHQRREDPSLYREFETMVRGLEAARRGVSTAHEQ
jgi:hypothetical protein